MILRHEAVAELWRRGVLSWKFHAGQETIEAAYKKVNAKLFVGNCARRYGKTTWAIIKAIECAIQSPKAKVIIATAFSVDCEEIVIPIFQELLSDCPDRLCPTFNKVKKKYLFSNRSEISLVGLDKRPNAGRGRRISLYIIDEAAFVTKLNYVYSSVIIPMTMFQPEARIILISTPPVSPTHPFKEFCLKAQKENAYVELTIHQNPMCDAKMIEEYRNECQTRSEFEREYECKFVVDEALAIIPEWKQEFVVDVKYDQFYNYYHKYCAADWGVRDKTAVLWAYYDFKRAKIVVEHEYLCSGADSTTRNIASNIKAIESKLGYTKIHRRPADNNELILLQDLATEFNLHFFPTTKDTLSAMVNEARLWVSSGRVEVSKNCPELIACLQYGVYQDEKRDKFGRSIALGHYDALAAFIYLVRNIDQHTNPIPHNYGYTENTFDPNVWEDPQSKTVKQIFNIG